MCYACWEEAGCPVYDVADVHLAASAVKELYRFCCVGGHLHIVVDDWNVDDSNLDFCQECIDKNEDGQQESILAIERECLKLLRPLTPSERLSALALEEGFWGKP